MARLWDLEGEEIHVLQGHDSSGFSHVDAVAFSPNEELILTGSADLTAKLWDLEGDEIQSFRGHQRDVVSVAFSPNGKYILTGSLDRTAKLWDLEGKVLRSFLEHNDSYVSSVAFSPDGKYILTGSWDTSAKLRHNPMHSWDPRIYQLSEAEREAYGIDIDY